MKMVSYVRVSTESQVVTGYGLEAQREAIQRRAEDRGWTLIEVEDAGVSGGKTDRPGLDYALGLLASHQADGLICAKLDRLARSALHFYTLVEVSQKQGWSLVLLQPDVDLTTDWGKMTAGVLASIAEYERSIIRERTRAALKVAKDLHGVVPGPKPIPVADDVAARILVLRDQGVTSKAIIAHHLTVEGFPLPSGKQGIWTPTQIARCLTRIDAAAATLDVEDEVDA